MLPVQRMCRWQMRAITLTAFMERTWALRECSRRCMMQPEASGVEFMYNTEATKLIVENGKVVGAEALSEGKTISIKANKGVIIATSSIDHNQDMSKALSPNQYYDNANSICAAPRPTPATASAWRRRSADS